MVGLYEVVDEVGVQDGLDDACDEGSHDDEVPVEDPGLDYGYQWKT